MPLKPREVIDASDPRVAQIGHPSPPWMVNYADLMTGMVCFYVILYALSAALSKPMQEAHGEIQQAIQQEGMAGEVKMTRDGLVVSLQEQGYKVLFHSGSADLTDAMREALDRLAPTFRKLAERRHDIIVEGHTDNVPIRAGGVFRSNWELSTARATNVVRYLVDKHAYPPQHLGAVGYGEYKNLPRERDEDLVAWRDRNRRVVFVIKNPDPTFVSGLDES